MVADDVGGEDVVVLSCSGEEVGEERGSFVVFQ